MKKESLYFLITFLAYPGYYVFLALLMFVNAATLLPSMIFRLSYLLLFLTLLALGDIRIRKDFVTLIFCLYAVVVVAKIILMPVLYPGFEFSRPLAHYLGYFLLLGVLPFFAFKGINLRVAYTHMEKGFMWGGMAVILLCIYLYREVITSGVGRLSESAYLDVEYATVNPLSLSYSAAISAGLAWVQLQQGHSSRQLNIMIIIFAVFGMLLGSSKGAMLGFVLAFVLVGRKKQAFSVSSWVSVTILCLGVYAVVQNSTSNLFHRFTELGTDNSSVQRIQYYRDALAEFSHNPIWGGQIELNGTYPHNFFIELLMCTGLVGAIFSVSMFALCLRGLSTHRRNLRMFPVVLFSIGFIYSMVSDSMFSSILLYSSWGLATNTTAYNATQSQASPLFTSRDV